MKYIITIMFLLSFRSFASVIGVSTHPFARQARVLSAEMTGYMSDRHEMGMGLRYMQEFSSKVRMDFSAASAQDSRAFSAGTGVDFRVLSEDLYQPRVSIKAFFQTQRFESQRSSLIGFAPTLRKGFAAAGVEFFPYLALPNGIKIDSETDIFVYSSALTMGASMPFPGDDKFVLSIEGNRDFGATSDYLGAMISWAWN